MFARNVSINLKPNSANEFTQTFEQDILPLLRKQNGFKDEITFLGEDGKDAVAISLWDRKESADAVRPRDLSPGAQGPVQGRVRRHAGRAWLRGRQLDLPQDRREALSPTGGLGRGGRR